MLDGPASGIDRWVELDPGVWRDHGSDGPARPLGVTPFPRKAVPSPHPAQARPRTGPVEHEDAAPAIPDVIRAWRAAERELAGLPENDPDRDRLMAEVIDLRALHHRLFAARSDLRPVDRPTESLLSIGARAWGRLWPLRGAIA